MSDMHEEPKNFPRKVLVELILEDEDDERAWRWFKDHHMGTEACGDILPSSQAECDLQSAAFYLMYRGKEVQR